LEAREKVYPRGVIERGVEREEIKETHPSLEKCRIGIIGLSAGAGVSFLTLALAKAISEHGLVPAVAELGKSGIYDALGMDVRFSGRQFFSYHQALDQNMKIRARDNFDEGINWALRCPGEDHIRLGASKMLRLIDNIRGEVVLCDFSGVDLPSQTDTLTAEMLRDMDGLIAVADPLPSRLLGSYPQFLELSTISKEIVYVINKDNRGVKRKEVNRMLKLEKPIYLPFIEPEEIYRAEYSCGIAYGNAAVKRQMKDPVREILRRVMPPELLAFQDRGRTKRRS